MWDGKSAGVTRAWSPAPYAQLARHASGESAQSGGAARVVHAAARTSVATMPLTTRVIYDDRRMARWLVALVAVAGCVDHGPGPQGKKIDPSYVADNLLQAVPGDIQVGTVDLDG